MMRVKGFVPVFLAFFMLGLSFPPKTLAEEISLDPIDIEAELIDIPSEIQDGVLEDDMLDNIPEEASDLNKNEQNEDDMAVSEDNDIILTEEIAAVNVQKDILMDVNGDGIIDIKDISLVLFMFGANPEDEMWPEKHAADVNNDSLVDMADVTLLIESIQSELYY